jgi:peptide/nickel transport system ATP-binding protein
MSDPLLELRAATKRYQGGSFASGQKVVGLEDFDLVIPGDDSSIIAIAGESGSGKSTLANAILGFFRLTSGQLLFEGRDVASFRREDWRQYRNAVQAVFQDPYESFNPFYRTRHVFRRHLPAFRGRSGPERRRVEEALESVGLEGADVLDKYPHQLSGGQRQRVMMARLMMLQPKLVIADEPVSMVDAAHRKTILDLMLKMRDEQGISILYITHDLSTARRFSDEIHILYAGRLAESGPTTEIIDRPHHPYVQLLVDSVPTMHKSETWLKEVKLQEEEAGRHSREGCGFYERCPQRMDRCRASTPPVYVVGDDDHHATCFLYDTATPGETGERGRGSEPRPSS